MSDRNHGAPAIELKGVGHRYSGVLALADIDLSIEEGSFTAVLGPNGAGKSTLGLLIARMLKPTAGTITRTRPDLRVALVPEGRRLFGQLTVQENLMLGGYGAGCNARETKRRIERSMVLMPKALREDPGRYAATLSGGERQMLALGRALMADPEVLLLDEPSLGLAPILIQAVYDVLRDLHAGGVTVVVIEQLATHALKHAGTMFLLERGRVVYRGDASGDAAEAALRAGYVGETAAPHI